MNNRLAAVLLVAGGLVVGLALSEAAYRVARRFVCIGSGGGGMLQPHPVYGWQHLPGFRSWQWECVGRRFEWRVYNRISSEGLRDVEHDVEKTPGTVRVLLLGDSMTQAVQVPLERTFARLLEAELARRGVPAEVVNTGVAGYGTDNQLLYYRTDGRRWSADLVLLVFNLQNDVLENSWTLFQRMNATNPMPIFLKPHFRLDAKGTLVLEPPADVEAPRDGSGPLARAWDVAARHAYVLRALERAVGPVAGAESKAPPSYPLIFDVYASKPDAAWTEAWEVTRALIRALRAEVEADGARFAVALMPGREQVTPILQHAATFFPALAGRLWDVDRPDRTIAAFLTAEGIPFVALRPAFHAHLAATGSSGYFGWDVHLAPDGHRIVAGALTDFLAPIVRTPSEGEDAHVPKG